MLRTKVHYVGESCYGKGDRFAFVYVANMNDGDTVETILDNIGYKYHGFGDGVDKELYYWVEVEDKDDYRNFMDCWKSEKKKLTI